VAADGRRTVGEHRGGVPTEEKELDEVAGNVTASDVKTAGKMRERKALVHGHDVSHTITRVDDNTSQQTCTISTDVRNALSDLSSTGVRSGN
jgi:hypothetical protein